MHLNVRHQKSTDGYGFPILPFGLPDPPLQAGWRVVQRHRSEDGEHIWIILTQNGEEFRWLEDESGPEWAFRQRMEAALAI